MIKLVLRNYNKSRGKLVRDTYDKETMIDYIEGHKYELVDLVFADEDNFLDLEKNGKLLNTFYNCSCESDIEYLISTLENLD